MTDKLTNQQMDGQTNHQMDRHPYGYREMDKAKNFLDTLNRTSIGVGRGPSGPSREGPFCRTVRLCRALETEK